MKKRYLLPILLIGALAAAFFLLRTPDTDPAQMTAKYGGAAARFAETPDGLRIHYRDQGNTEGVPIIFIHGTSSSLHTWEPLAERLGDEYRIISYDQPGHGLTGPSLDENYSAHGMMKALDAVAAAAGVDRFILAGNSMGGWVSWRYALENPDRLKALILLDAAGAPLLEGEKPPPLNLGFRLMKVKWLRPLLEQITPRSIVERSVYDTVAVDSIVTDEMVDCYWELLRYPGNRRAAALRTDVDREQAMFDRIPEITAPAFVIWGAEDQLIYASAAQTFHDRLPNSDIFILNGVGHLPMEEAPDLVAEEIRKFLADRGITPVGDR
ncbi:MAG: alpha/beta hydrolase [Amphiplicatus sp.]